jgi:hypothetical protein
VAASTDHVASRRERWRRLRAITHSIYVRDPDDLTVEFRSY